MTSGRLLPGDFAKPGRKPRYSEDQDFPGGPVAKAVLPLLRAAGSVLGWETRIPHARQHGQRK